MSGYTPAFDTIYTGTLYGKWPMAAVWASLLPLIDKHGQINLSFEAIAGMTGWPMGLLQQGISQLEQPDPDSRTDSEEGRRIIRLDPRRPWGWRVVNHALYREKARKQSHDERRRESGENAERMKARRDVTRDDPTRPDETREHPLSDSNADSDKSKNAPDGRLPDSPEGGTPRKRRGKAQCQLVPLPTDFALTDRMREQALKKHADADVEAWFEQFCAHHRAHAKVMASWSQAWVTWIGNGVKFGYPRKKEVARESGGLKFAN